MKTQYVSFTSNKNNTFVQNGLSLFHKSNILNPIDTILSFVLFLSTWLLILSLTIKSGVFQWQAEVTESVALAVILHLL